LIEKMTKLRLAGLISQKEKILDALFLSRCVQLKNMDLIDGTENKFNEEEYNSLLQRCERLSSAISLIEENIKFFDKHYLSSPVLISPQELDILPSKDSLETILDEVEKLSRQKNALELDKVSLENKISLLAPYIVIDEPFSYYKDTKNVAILIGKFNVQNYALLQEFLKDYPLTICALFEENKILKVYSHKRESKKVVEKLNELGFVRATFDYDLSASQKIEELKKEIQNIEDEILEKQKALSTFKNVVTDLKIARDYFYLKSEEVGADKGILSTTHAFILECFVPEKCKDKIEKILLNGDFNIEYEFARLSKTDSPPTLLTNSPIVRPFEVITNNYSVPNYRELDPNIFIMFFFSLFFGFIMADIGYGMVLILFGLAIAYKTKNENVKKLFQVFAIGGVTSIVFGILFGSFFGLTHTDVSLIPVAVMPNPSKDVLSLLGICLGAGVVQIMVSFALKGVLYIKNKMYAQAFFSAFIWEIFFVGALLCVLQLVSITTGTLVIGLALAISSAVVSTVAQIFLHKGFDKLSQSFMQVYGVINIFSDILSYARLFGLMLSGNIIAGIVDNLATPFVAKPQTLVLGAIILVVGHVFNIAIGVLGAYIHVSRLQYVEFFSRFYEGEGNLFEPMGSNLMYVKFNEN